MFEIEKWQDNKQSIIRQFSVKAFDECATLILSIEHFVKMKDEIEDYYNELMKNSENRLKNAIKLKNQALNSCIHQQIKQRNL